MGVRRGGGTGGGGGTAAQRRVASYDVVPKGVGRAGASNRLGASFVGERARRCGAPF